LPCSASPSSPNTDDMREAKSIEVISGLARGPAPSCAPTIRWPPSTARRVLPIAVEYCDSPYDARPPAPMRWPSSTEWNEFQVPEPRGGLRSVMRRPDGLRRGATSGSRSGCAASASNTTRSAASPSCRPPRSPPMRGTRHGRPPASSAPISASFLLGRGCDVVGNGQLHHRLAGQPSRSFRDARGFRVSSSTTSRSTSRSRVRSTGSCTSRALPRRSTISSLPDPDAQGWARSARTNAPGAELGQGARALPARLHLRGLRRSTRASANARTTGSRQPHRPAGACTTRPKRFRGGDDDGLPPACIVWDTRIARLFKHVSARKMRLNDGRAIPGLP